MTGQGMWDGGRWMQGRMAEGIQHVRDIQMPEQMNGGRGVQREHWVVGHGTDGVTAGLCLGGGAVSPTSPLSWGSSATTYPISPILDPALFFPKRPRTHLRISISSSEEWDPRKPWGRGRGRGRGQGP